MKRVLCLMGVLFLITAGCRSEAEHEVVDQREREKAQERQLQEEQQLPPPATNGVIQQGQWPLPEGEPFLRYITQQDPYKQWDLWPGTKEMDPGTEPHGAFLITYVNDPARAGIERKSGQMPDRAIVVKENYTPDRELSAITAMYKVAGYKVSAERPDGGEWFWIQFSPDGIINDQGKIEGCITCHERARDNDYLFTSYIGQ
jgi:hypothetical protein